MRCHGKTTGGVIEKVSAFHEMRLISQNKRNTNSARDASSEARLGRGPRRRKLQSRRGPPYQAGQRSNEIRDHFVQDYDFRELQGLPGGSVLMCGVFKAGISRVVRKHLLVARDTSLLGQSPTKYVHQEVNQRKQRRLVRGDGGGGGYRGEEVAQWRELATSAERGVMFVLVDRLRFLGFGLPECEKVVVV